MPYDEALADRLREALLGRVNFTERRMFGGLAFLVGGHLAVAASGQGGLLLRCDPARTDDLVVPPTVVRMEMRGREMDGWLRVAAAAAATEEDLERWVEIGVGYAAALTPKD
jgi:hypothetical protein